MSDDGGNDDNNYSCDYSSSSNDDNNYSYDYSPNNNDYNSSNTTADQDTSTYAYTETAPIVAPEDDWTEQHEVTTLSFSDAQYEIPDNNSTEERNTTTYTPVNETTEEYTPSCENNSTEDCNTTTYTPANETTVEYSPSSGIIESREVFDYRTDDVTIPICDFPREREYVRVREYNTVASPPPRIHRYKHLHHVSSQFQRERQALDQIDISKLTNTEYIQYTRRYAEVLDAEEKRQNRKRKEKQECKHILLALVGILCGISLAIALLFKISADSSARF